VATASGEAFALRELQEPAKKRAMFRVKYRKREPQRKAKQLPAPECGCTQDCYEKTLILIGIIAGNSRGFKSVWTEFRKVIPLPSHSFRKEL